MYSGFGNPKRLNLIVANSLSEIAAAGAAAQLAARGNLGLGTSDTVQFSKLGLGVANSLGALDIATHSTSAGGLWLGSDVSLYRSGAGALTTNSAFFTGGDIIMPNGSAFRWSGRGRLYSDGDGVIRLSNDAGTSFSLLRFGGGTNAFPALKRNGAVIDVRLADDSAAAGLQADMFFLNTGSVQLRSGAGTPEGAIAAPVGSIYLRIDGGAGTTLYVKQSGAGNTGWTAK